MIELNKIYNEDCLEGMKRIPDKSLDAIVTDPPYLYLKHKLDRPWNEDAVFAEWNRILKDDGFIVMFGRGIPFYRWNTKINNLGFNFKEEIIWDKKRSTSPLLKIARVHESISIFSKSGKLNEVRIPYLEIRENDDISRIVQDIKRIKSAINNAKSLEQIKFYLENKKINLVKSKAKNHSITISENSLKKEGDTAAKTMRMLEDGMQERSIISIKKEIGHFSVPTQKPVRLMERLLKLVSGEGALVLDPFAGSGSTALACQNLNRNFIGFEIDKEYFEIAQNRIEERQSQISLFDEVSE
jgi:site-specific DNA-methyltransferase (adenine-specific)